MEITTKQLRIQPGKVILQVFNGQEITITYRGEPRAKIVPLIDKQAVESSGYELFGIWKNRKDMEKVEEFIKSKRKRKKL